MDLGNWFARRSEDQYARPVERTEELRPDLQTALATTLEPGEPIYAMIFAPYQGRLKQRKDRRRFGFLLPWQLTPNWLLALTSRHLLMVSVLEDSSPTVVSIPLETILHLQSGVILLLSWFEVTWVENGAVRCQSVYFNAVCERFFDQLCLLIRERLSPQPARPATGTWSNREILEPLPYRFKNLIPMRLLMPGEQILEVAFRPAAFTRAFGIFQRMVAPRLAVALTDRQLLLAEEDLSESESSYGFTATFVPVQHVCGATLLREEKGVILQLRLELRGAEKEIAIPFPPEREGEVQMLVEKLRVQSN